MVHSCNSSAGGGGGKETPECEATVGSMARLCLSRGKEGSKEGESEETTELKF